MRLPQQGLNLGSPRGQVPLPTVAAKGGLEFAQGETPALLGVGRHRQYRQSIAEILPLVSKEGE